MTMVGKAYQPARLTRAAALALAIACAAFGSVGAANAAVPVEESVGITRDGNQGAAVAASAGQAASGVAAGGIGQGTPWSGSAPAVTAGAAYGSQPIAGGQPAGSAPSENAQLFYQTQMLEQQVQQLRGLVEELSHQVRQLSADQQAQYRDLDGRIVALRSGGGAASPTAGGAVPGIPATGVQPTGSQPAGPSPASERDAYSAAFELMNGRKFPEATASFNRFIQDYPNGTYAANAYYWLGELYLAQNDLERARQAFGQVVARFPDNQKVPDALYKDGVVHHRLGDVAKAREFLNRVVAEYPQSTVAAKAKTYLTELQ